MQRRQLLAPTISKYSHDEGRIKRTKNTSCINLNGSSNSTIKMHFVHYNTNKKIHRTTVQASRTKTKPNRIHETVKISDHEFQSQCNSENSRNITAQVSVTFGTQGIHKATCNVRKFTTISKLNSHHTIQSTRLGHWTTALGHLPKPTQSENIMKCTNQKDSLGNWFETAHTLSSHGNALTK
jgi:hypothetical protein